jgi:hypothetical protein
MIPTPTAIVIWHVGVPFIGGLRRRRTRKFGIQFFAACAAISKKPGAAARLFIASNYKRIDFVELRFVS